MHGHPRAAIDVACAAIVDEQEGADVRVQIAG